MTPRERFEWMEAVLADAALTAATKVVAQRLALHLNLQTGICNPSWETLARETSQSRATIARALDRLERAGRIRRATHQGRSTDYLFITRLTDETGSTPTRRISEM